MIAKIIMPTDMSMAVTDVTLAAVRLLSLNTRMRHAAKTRPPSS